MLQAVPKSKSEQKRLEVMIRQYEKQQRKLVSPSAIPLATPNPELPVAIIVDVDGTLAYRGNRAIFDFDKSIFDDKAYPLTYILKLIDDANKWQNNVVSKTHIIILTGRDENNQEVTNAWLNKHQIPFDHIYMRRKGDNRPAPVIKEEIYVNMIRDKYNVLFVLDDDLRNIDMFRSHGLYCLIADNSRER